LDMILQQLDAGIDPLDVNLTPLLCGSEGTLGWTLGAQLRLHPKPKVKALAVVAFPTLDEAIGAVPAILHTRPSAVELLDDLVIGLARANAEYRAYAELLPALSEGGEPKAVLYVEYFAENAAEIESRITALRRAVSTNAIAVHQNAQAMLQAWKLRKAGEPLLHGIPGARKPITFIEDNAIPVENLARFVKELRGIVAKHGTRAAFYAHASVGVLHVRPLLDIHDSADRVRMQAIALETADLARSLGGVMSGEHGDGRVRSPLLERFYGPELMEAFREVKRLFDPRNLLNPGNIVDLTGDRPRPIESMTESLRVEPMRGRPVTFPQELQTYYTYDDEHGFDGAVEMCNGSGVCRKAQGGTMCPSYMATLDERHSTRGRGNALRLAITGQLRGEHAGSIWQDPGTAETLRLCLSCKACKTECPSNVDVAKLKAEYIAQGHKESSPSLATRVMGSVRTLNRVGAIFPGLANRVSNTPIARSIINRLIGIDARRSLPTFSRSLAAVWGRPAKQVGDQPTVVLFGDCFTMYNESSIGVATKRVYEAFGYRVLLADAGCCGRAKISLGLLGEAIVEADATIERLRKHIEDDAVVAILFTEPSCLSAIKDDWRTLKLATPMGTREKLVKKSWLAEEFLERAWDTHPKRPAWRAPEGNIIMHGHCHQKALWGAATSSAILARVVGAGRVRVLDSGCCGMAGSFGFSPDRYDLSMRIGELTLLPAARAAGIQDTLIAPGTSCRHQIHDGAHKRALHPMQALAEWLATTPA
jgi:Fe-S oxidoreductase